MGRQLLMSKVPYTVNVDEYICSNLEQIRGMLKSYDFSGLAAAVERIQYHATKMENALYTYEDVKYNIADRVDKEDLSDKEFREYVRGRVKKWKDND
jgi:hypothetical protein